MPERLDELRVSGDDEDPLAIPNDQLRGVASELRSEIEARRKLCDLVCRGER
jgi:hypothetical protein